MKKISWDRVMSLVCLECLFIFVIFVFVGLFSTSCEDPLEPYPTRMATPPNLECFQVIGKIENKDPGYNAIKVYWCRDRNDLDKCYWFRPGLEPVQTQCNKTIFREMD